jgi:hypothetical protein
VKDVLQTVKETNPMIVNLTDKITVETIISSENHAALRAGFAGYPSNPRWSVTKYSAWKTGATWRNALQNGEMLVRESDLRLISVKEQAGKIPITESPKFDFSVFAKQLLSYSRSKKHSTV